MTQNVNPICIMIDKDKLPEFIDRYNNNQLQGKELEEFVELMKQNPDLREEVKLDKDLNTILADYEIIELRRKLIKNRIPQETKGPDLSFFLFAATAAILIGLVIFGYIWLRKTDNEIMSLQHELNLDDTLSSVNQQLTFEEQIAIDRAAVDTLISRKKRGEIKPGNDLVLTDNYSEFQLYEGMTGEVSRTASFHLLSPKSIDSYSTGNPVTFRWESKSIKKVLIIIANNKGEQVFVSPVITGNTFQYHTSKLKGGLYYYKFVSNDEIVYFGKFVLY